MHYEIGLNLFFLKKKCRIFFLSLSLLKKHKLQVSKPKIKNKYPARKNLLKHSFSFNYTTLYDETLLNLDLKKKLLKFDQILFSGYDLSLSPHKKKAPLFFSVSMHNGDIHFFIIIIVCCIYKIKFL